MLERLNKLTVWQASTIIVVVGLAVFFAGLSNPFQGDDKYQIVDNVPVHSITHLNLFFEGGTFYYSGGATKPLDGIYYRPLMTTTFSLLYTLFGAHTFYFHLLQLILCIANAILVYLIFRYFLGSLLSLVLSLIFLIHPLNSQVVYAIPSMQDALFFFFGMLSIWLLLRFDSIKSHLSVAACLFLSLLSKEAGGLFVCMALLYLFWFNRKRFLLLASILALPVTLYLILKIHAVGFDSHLYYHAPIEDLSFIGRLLTAPSIFLFYLYKLVFPLKLASGYYWVYPTFSFSHVLIPLAIDTTAVAFVMYLMHVIRERVSKKQALVFQYFAVWAGLGTLVLLVIPTDFTASETWFYFPMVGVLGLIGMVLVTFQERVRPSWFFLAATLIICLLGARTSVRAFDWRSAYVLAGHDIAASKEDYSAYSSLAIFSYEHGDFTQAKMYASRSISIYPTSQNYESLGISLVGLGNYSGATNAFQEALGYGGTYTIDQNIADLYLVYGDHDPNLQSLQYFTDRYPNVSWSWLCLAIFEQEYGDNLDAKDSLAEAGRYGQVPQRTKDAIINNQKISVKIVASANGVFVYAQ